MLHTAGAGAKRFSSKQKPFKSLAFKISFAYISPLMKMIDVVGIALWIDDVGDVRSHAICRLVGKHSSADIDIMRALQ